MKRLRLPFRISLFLFVLCLLISTIIFVVIQVPNPLTVRDQVGEAKVLFETPDSIIFSHTNCYRVRWQVEGVEAVYLNDQGKIGQGEQRLCYRYFDTPELRVVFSDDSHNTYRLNIVVVQQQPIFWVFIAICAVLIFVSAYFLVIPFFGIKLTSRKSLAYASLNLVVFTILIILVGGGGLELSMRHYFSNYGTESDRIRYIYSSDDLQIQASRFIGLPNVLYGNNPNYTEHNELGYRGDSFSLKKPAGTFRIVAIGASATYGFGVNAHQAYPAVLQDVLRDDYHYRHVEVINAGVLGYSSYEVLANFQFRLLELDPDLLLYYGAKTDADTRFEDPGCFNDPSPLYGLTTYQGLWRTEFDDLPQSTLYRYFAINTGLINAPKSIGFALGPIPIAESCYVDETYDRQELLEINSTKFVERNMRNLLALANFHNIDVVISEFVYPTELSQVDGDENLIMSPEQVQSVAEINALYSTIADDMNVHYYELSQDFVIEPGMFWTNVHMRASGTKEQARLYAQYLVDNNLIPAPELN